MEENTKYELLKDDTKVLLGTKLYRVRALKNFDNVKKGDIGGYIESTDNLSIYDNAWVSGNAWVFGNARVSDEARVSGNARVYGEAEVYGNARVYGDAWVSGNARVASNSDYIVFNNNWSSGRYFTWTKSNNMWKVGCFYGTGEELIEKAYKDSEISGKNYEAYVKLVENLKEINQGE